MIVIIDYGMGNLKSVSNALKKLDLEYIISDSKEDIKAAKGLILPGVGAFKDGMENIRKKDLEEVIKEEVNSGKPLFGICLGMQMLFEKGFEGEETWGFGFLKGKIKRIYSNENVKIPHIGWNSLDIKKDDSIIKGLSMNSFVYYVHSYFSQECDKEDVIATSRYGGIDITGLVRKDNIIGAQFHPEKSGEVGLWLLKNFGEMIK